MWLPVYKGASIAILKSLILWADEVVHTIFQIPHYEES